MDAAPKQILVPRFRVNVRFPRSDGLQRVEPGSWLLDKDSNGAATRIRTGDPRITNSQVSSTTHINRSLANDKRGFCRENAWNIDLCWYQSGHSKRLWFGMKEPLPS